MGEVHSFGPSRRPRGVGQCRLSILIEFGKLREWGAKF